MVYILRQSENSMGIDNNKAPPQKNVMLPSPDQNLKIGSVGRDFFFFFFFFTYRERVEFSNIFF